VEENSRITVDTVDEAVQDPYPSGYPTPLRILVITLVSIFIAELIIMFLLARIPPIPETLEMFLDSFLLVILVCPILYFFFLSPILLNITERKVLEKKLALTDKLTGLYSRRGFLAVAEHQMKIATRQRQGFFLLRVRMDNLHEINDTLGQQEGDRALVDIATILKEHYCDSDIIARIGADKFAVVQFGSPDDGDKTVTARLQQKLDGYNRTGNNRYSLSLSTGVVFYDPDSPRSIDDLLAEAGKL
jgi:diguanylate cyclase (GGDEF)-like protein